MKLRFYLDPETDLPHIYKHEVSENEIAEVLQRPGEDRPGQEGSRVALAKQHPDAICGLSMFPIPDPTAFL